MTYSGSQPVDRRANTRRNVQVPININPSDVSAPITGKIQDISPGGMKVKPNITPSPLKKRDEVWFLVNRDYLKFEGLGKILWTSRLDDAVGIKFTQLDEKSKGSLEEFLGLFENSHQ